MKILMLNYEYPPLRWDCLVRLIQELYYEVQRNVRYHLYVINGDFERVEDIKVWKPRW